MVQSLIPKEQGEQGEDEEVKSEVTQDEIFAVIQQIRKSKDKKGACWNCDEIDYCSRDCPNDKQNSSGTDGAPWKNQSGEKAGKDAG